MDWREELKRTGPRSRDERKDIFKTYEDKGWEVKKQVTAFVTWLTPANIILIGLSYDKYCSGGRIESQFFMTTAMVISIFMVVVVFQSLKHADRDYEKADKALC